MPCFAFQELGIQLPAASASRNVKTTCPQCSSTRGNPRDKSLSVNIDTGAFKCHHCGWQGTAQRFTDEEKREYARLYGKSRPAVPRKAPQVGNPPNAQRAECMQQTVMAKTYRKPADRPAAPLSARAIAYCAARGISMATLEHFSISQTEVYSRKLGRRVSALRFPFFCKGELRNVKTRSAAKEFLLEAGCELLPYNIDAIKGKSDCIITEGEFDALAFHECGYTSVVSVPNGAGGGAAFLDTYEKEYFSDKKTIYIAVDTDPAGLKLRDALLARLGAARCRVVTYGPSCKDANELLQRGGKQAVRDALRAAEGRRMGGITSLRDYEEELENLYLNGMPRGATLGFEELDNLISFETKRLCVVTGVPGSGKSEFIDQMAERLNARYGWKFAFFTPENAPTYYHSVKLIEKFTGCAFSQRTLPRADFEAVKAHLDQAFFYISPDAPTLDNILDCAEYLVDREGIKALVIDPYNRVECEMGAEQETLYISAFLDRLTAFAQRMDIIVFLVAHPRKMARAPKGGYEIPTLYDISGSAHFFNKADYGLVVHRHRADDTIQISVQKVKFKHLGGEGDAFFKYDLRNGRYAPYADGEPPVFDASSHVADAAAATREADAAEKEVTSAKAPTPPAVPAPSSAPPPEPPPPPWPPPDVGIDPFRPDTYDTIS